MDFEVLYLPIGVPTFHLESAQKEFDKSVALLKRIDENVKVPDKMLLSLDLLDEFLKGKNPDLIIVQNITFANGAYIADVLSKVSCPVLLWTLREPVIDGGRLRLNSLTGAFSASNVLKSFARPYQYIFGSPKEKEVERIVSASIAAAKVKKSMKGLNILQIGHTPQGFGFGRALDNEMLTTFGANLLSIEARELIDQAKQYSDEDINDYLKDANNRICGLDKINEKNVKDFARLYRSYDEYTKKNHIGALSSRCWPDYFTAFGTPVCAVLAILNDLNIPSACEADTYGALSMYVCQYLTGMPVFFGDPVSLDEKENTITFWHCGTAACSLARNNKANAGVHCNRKIGPTLEFGCKQQEAVTIFRIGKDAQGKFRFFIASGSAPDKEQQFFGTDIVVETKSKSKDIIYNGVNLGWEPHFVVAMKDIADELEILGKFLGLEVERY
jgi:L-fucose isomerase-like protein